jgi:hypothetical protein
LPKKKLGDGSAGIVQRARYEYEKRIKKCAVLQIQVEKHKLDIKITYTSLLIENGILEGGASISLLIQSRTLFDVIQCFVIVECNAIRKLRLC